MEYGEQVVAFRKGDISLIARIITYVDIKKGKTSKLMSLPADDFDMAMETIAAICRRRRQIGPLPRQTKQDFPQRGKPVFFGMPPKTGLFPLPSRLSVFIPPGNTTQRPWPSDKNRIIKSCISNTNEMRINLRRTKNQSAVIEKSIGCD